MLKLGIIGLGDIAQKAYLPVISNKNAEIHLYTRDQARLFHIGEQYRFKHLHPSLGSLINSGITGAIVSTSTASHFEIVEQLLLSNIHVYVDKPITYEYESSEKLVLLARQKKLILTVGFNRRYAPAYQKLKEIQSPNMIIMQKNRKLLPASPRQFIFDDFIHVVDTLLYLFPYPIDKLMVHGKKKGELLYHVAIQFVSSEGNVAMGIMNRDSGTTEEKLEVFTTTEKRVVYNVTDTVIFQNKNETRVGANDWEPTLYKRGFEQMIDDFLKGLESRTPHQYYKSDPLQSHKICEDVLAKLN